MVRIGAAFLAVVLVSLVGAFGALASPGDTERVSVDSGGSEANDFSYYPAMSANGRFVAFTSSASNLVPGDANVASDVFVRDRQTGATERVSVDSGGNEGNDLSNFPAISADGRFVTFVSEASNLVPGDTNGREDVFIHDRQTGTTERVSVDSGGNQGNGHSSTSAISADGRFVAFTSGASNLVPGDTNDTTDVFVRDRLNGTTDRVSVDSGGSQGNDFSGNPPAISADGRFVAFSSLASNLVGGDSNNEWDIFVHDRQTGATERVNTDSAGNEANGFSSMTEFAISADGRFVTFHSGASNLVLGDTNSVDDVFVHDRQNGTTERVSVDNGGNEGDGHSVDPAISADGRFVAFWSSATNLVPGDTNGVADVLVRDRQTSTTEQVSVDSAGNAGDGDSLTPAISGGGRFIAFYSLATNLVPGDINGTADVFVHDRGPAGDNSTSEDGQAGDTVSTNTTTSPEDPSGTSVTTPVAGTVTIDEGSTTTPDPTGYSLLGQQVQITAPDASAADPLVLQFRLDASLLPPGADETNVQVFRDGVAMPDCDAGAGTSATPDPCVATRTATADGIELTVRTSQASTWNFGVAAGDTTPPDTTIDSGPSGLTNDSTPTFAFSSSESGSTFECRFDSAAFAPCSGPGATHTPATALSEGSHTFDVRATDQANNTDQSPASRSFTVDTQAPNTTITSGPSGPTGDSTPTFGFSSSEAGSSFQCRVDGDTFSACSSPKTLAALSDGSHTFRVRAIDQAGNTDQSPGVRTFTVDTHSPDTTITSGPSGPTNDSTPTFGFTSSEPQGATFQCRIDSGAFSACSSPKTLSALADGSHTFRVRATDQAGNTDQSPASRTFTVDTQAPNTTITSGPSGTTHDRTPTFAFTSSEPTGAAFQCRLDGASFSACSSPKTYPKLSLGTHTFRVRALDRAGNADPTPAVRSFNVK